MRPRYLLFDGVVRLPFPLQRSVPACSRTGTAATALLARSILVHMDRDHSDIVFVVESHGDMETCAFGSLHA